MCGPSRARNLNTLSSEKPEMNAQGAALRWHLTIPLYVDYGCGVNRLVRRSLLVDV